MIVYEALLVFWSIVAALFLIGWGINKASRR